MTKKNIYTLFIYVITILILLTGCSNETKTEDDLLQTQEDTKAEIISSINMHQSEIDKEIMLQFYDSIYTLNIVANDINSFL